MINRKILLVLCLLTALCLSSGCRSVRTENEKDFSWWPTKSTPAPVKDKVRSGSWWYPTTPEQADPEDKDLWANRGYIYVNKSGETVVESEDKKAIEQMVLEDVHFEYDKAVLSDEGKAILAKVAEIMQRNPNFFLSVEGHTCSIGSEGYNLKLGQRRADAARNYLIEIGVSGSLMRAISWGETRLKYKDKTSPDFALNRRVEFRVIEG